MKASVGKEVGERKDYQWKRERGGGGGEGELESRA